MTLNNVLTYLVLLIEVGSFHCFHIQLEGVSNVVHHALHDEDPGQSAGRPTGTIGSCVGLHRLDNNIPVGYMIS